MAGKAAQIGRVQQSFDVRRATAQGRYAGLKVNCGGVESIIAQREGSANELLVWTLLRAGFGRHQKDNDRLQRKSKKTPEPFAGTYVEGRPKMSRDDGLV